MTVWRVPVSRPQRQLLILATTFWPREDEPRLLVQVALDIPDLDPDGTVRSHQSTVQEQGHRGVLGGLLKLGQVTLGRNDDGALQTIGEVSL